MLSEELNLWIAQSESWQTFVDFRHSEESVSSYPFLKRPDDFYISLFGSLGKILENSELETEKILSVAKGLEIYSLQTKRDTFQGVDQANNILFAAGLYYLANYAPSASILANIYNFNNYDEDIEKFLLSFLNRKKIEKNIYRDILDEYLEIGDEGYLDKLITIIQEKKEFYFKFNPHLFFLYLLSEKILLKFKKNNIWIDLLGVNNDKFFWEKYIEKSITKKFPVWDFFPSQKQALDKGILGDFKAISLQTPTSSGKTAISELLIYNEVKRNPEGRILYLAPFRALASELKQSFGKNLEKLSIKSKTIYGGNIPTLEEKKSIQDVQLLISTPEKFMAIENVDSDFAEGFSMIICDEGHLLGEMGNRGLSYELLLARFRKDEGKKFVFLSAIVPNIKDINAWLGGKEENIVESSYRATEIEYAFLRKSGSRYNLEINPFQKIPKKYILNNFLTETDNLDKTELSKSTTIALKALNGGSVALFAPTKGPQGVNGLGKKLISQISKNTSLYSDSDLKENPQEKKIGKSTLK